MEKITNPLRIFEKCQYLNIEWLETGTGPMMIVDKDNFHLLPGNRPLPETSPEPSPSATKIAARIEPGSEGIKRLLIRKPSPQATVEKEQKNEPETPISDMVYMTTRVLESNTVYRSALASNVRAFYQAVVQEDEMKSLSEKMELMQAQMERMEAMLAALNAAMPQKRDEKAGDDDSIPGALSAV